MQILVRERGGEFSGRHDEVCSLNSASMPHKENVYTFLETHLYCAQIIVTSAKTVIFSPTFVCLAVSKIKSLGRGQSIRFFCDRYGSHSRSRTAKISKFTSFSVNSFIIVTIIEGLHASLESTESKKRDSLSLGGSFWV